MGVHKIKAETHCLCLYYNPPMKSATATQNKINRMIPPTPNIRTVGSSFITKFRTDATKRKILTTIEENAKKKIKRNKSIPIS